MFLDIAVLVIIATARWHQARRHDQQVAAAHQALVHLQAAYQQAAAAPLAALAQRKPLARTMERHAKRILVTLPDHAQQVLNDPAWPALTEAENAGHDPDQLLQHAARQYTLDDARSIARTLTWRVQRVGKGPAPKTRAPAAQARGATKPSADPDHTPATAALPERLHARQVSTVRRG